MRSTRVACGCSATQRPAFGIPRAHMACSSSWAQSPGRIGKQRQPGTLQAHQYLCGKKLSAGLKCLRQPRLTDRSCRVVRAAIFGVGAPEALLVGVVALVVFGPKGLAQAVKSLGATLRTFSPTIRELASVTNELSSTLQEQIGLDEIRNEFRNPATPYRGTVKADEVEDVVSSPQLPDAEESGDEASTSSQETEEELAAKIASSKDLAWKGSAPSNLDEAPAPTHDPQVREFAEQVSAKTGKSAADLSIEELEAELKRRREAPKA